MRSNRTRTTHSLVPSADYFTTTLKTYAYNKKSIQTLTSVARLALNLSRPFIDDSADVLDELFHPTYDCLAGLDVCLR